MLGNISYVLFLTSLKTGKSTDGWGVNQITSVALSLNNRLQFFIYSMLASEPFVWVWVSPPASVPHELKWYIC